MGALNRVAAAGPGVVAAAAGALLGVPWPAALAAGGVYVAAAVLGGRLGVLLAVLAAALVCLAAPAPTLFSLRGAGWAAVAVLAVLPVLLVLYPRLPVVGLLAVPAALVVPVAWLLGPWAPTLLASDVAPRLQALLLGTGALLALAASRSLQRRLEEAPRYV